MPFNNYTEDSGEAFYWHRRGALEHGNEKAIVFSSLVGAHPHWTCCFLAPSSPTPSDILDCSTYSLLPRQRCATGTPLEAEMSVYIPQHLATPHQSQRYREDAQEVDEHSRATKHILPPSHPTSFELKIHDFRVARPPLAYVTGSPEWWW